MITISADTKIAKILSEHQGALDAIVSISPKFNKLKKPLLRKIMASRTTILMASKVGGCTVEDFFVKLEPLGFIIDRSKLNIQSKLQIDPSDFFKKMNVENVVELDVRSVIDSGKDPFKIILEKVNAISSGQVLKLINSFEPAPLISLLESKGFLSYTEIIKDDLVFTYFYKTNNALMDSNLEKGNTDNDWDEVIEKYKEKTTEIDVRNLEMPRPMIVILENIENLTNDSALFVNHKKIPVYLLPQLQEQNFDYRIKEIGEGDVKMIIFRKV